MFRSPVTFKQPLARDDIESNGRVITALFFDEICNRDRSSKFSDILSDQIRRDSEENLQFLAAMRANSQRLGIDTEYVIVPQDTFLQTLSDVLSSQHIVLNPDIVKDTPDAHEQRALLYPFFRAILFAEANQRDTEIIERSGLDKEIIARAKLLHEKRMRSQLEEQAAFIQKIQVMRYMSAIKAFGDGDCFYHAVMLDIIHDVLTHSLDDDSPTGKQIQEQLLPAIAREISMNGGPSLDFSGLSLHDSILELLRAAPLSGLPSDLSARLVPDVEQPENEELEAIGNCDLYHLLRNACAPVLRRIMQTGAQTHEAEIKDRIHDILKNNFIAYTIRNHGGDLKFDPSITYTATQQWASSEFSDIPDEQSREMLASWEKVYSTMASQKEFSNLVSSNDDMKKIHLGEQFDNWWRINKDRAYKDYFNFHAQSHVKAGPPQQYALACQLQCNLETVDRKTGSFTSITPRIDNAHTLRLDNRPDHFDAIVGDPRHDGHTQLAVALHERTSSLNEHKSTLVVTPYLWQATVVDMDLRAAQSSPVSDIVQSTESVPVNEESVAASTQEVQSLITAHAKELSESLKLDVTSIQTINVEDESVTILDSSDNITKNLLIAAGTGYKAAKKNTLFGSASDSANTVSVDAKSRQEADDLLYAIQLQNMEIQNYFRRFKR